MIDPQAIQALLSSVDLVALISGDIQVKKSGKEYVALCPFHDDTNPSFSIFEKEGHQLCKCFACGWPKDIGAADAIRYVMDKRGLGFKDAYEFLSGRAILNRHLVSGFAAGSRGEMVAQEWISSKPPADLDPPDFTNHKLGGTPSSVWTYRDSGGAILGYIARYDSGSNGGRKKAYRPWTWGHFDGEDAEQWQSKAWTRGERPLYGLDRLATSPEKPVLVTEGEKACDAATALLGLTYVCVTWPGGAQALKHANLEPLRGRRLLLWPDADAAGMNCMRGLAAIAANPRSLACESVKMLDPMREPDGKAHGWDVADALAEGWDTAQIMAWARARISIYEPPSSSSDEPPPNEFPPEATSERPESKDDDQLPVEMSEDALSEAFAAMHAEDWRYVKVWHAWFEYIGHGWQEDKVGKLDRLAVELCRGAAYWPAAAQLTPSAKRALSTRRLWFSVRDTASNHERIRASVEQWDKHPLLLLTPGGVVDLRTGIIGPGEREHYLTKRTSVTPAHGAPALWLAHLRRMTGGDEDKVNFLHLYAGYCATGETREQCFAFLFGPGQNGKGVFVTTLARVLGDYAVFANSSTFMAAEGAERHLSEIARLQGARLVVVDETDSSKRWNEARVKSITGGGRITANRMRQDPFDFDPQFKLLIAGNHRPQIRGVGKAMRRRIKLVECLTEIPEIERDNYFDEKLRDEYPQILHWIIEGARMWLESGLTAPESIELATERYIQSEDVIGEWVEDCCVQKYRMETGAGYRAYCAWIEARNEKAWSRRAWNNAMSERGYDIHKSHGARYLIGVSLNATSGDNNPPSWHYDQDR